MKNTKSYINPMVMEMISDKGFKKSRSDDISILFNVRGETIISLNGNIYSMKKYDIIVCNPIDEFEIYQSRSTLLLISIKRSLLNISDELKSKIINCNSCIFSNKKSFNKLYFSIFRYIKEYNDISVIKATSIAYEILDILFSQYTSNQARGQNSKIEQILYYIEKNYQDNLLLNDIADEFGLTVPYLSKLFKDFTGKNFAAFYDELRITHSMYDLLETNSSILDISLKHGFANNQAYIRAYKKITGELPSETRKKHKFVTDREPFEDDSSIVEILKEVNQQNLTKDHVDYFINHDYQKSPILSFKEKPSHKIIGIGAAKILLYNNIQKLLQETQNFMPFKYAYIHGILSDDLSFCSRNYNNTLNFQFNLINEICDFLLSINLIPIISLTYMPIAIAKDKNKTVYSNDYNVSSPADLMEWKQLIEEFLNNMYDRYSDKLMDWIFVPWIQPDSSYKQFGFETDAEFYEFYKVTYETIKNFNSNIKVASPEIFPYENYNFNWMKNFLSFTRKSNCNPDLMALMFFDDDNWQELQNQYIKGKFIHFAKSFGFRKNPNAMHDYLLQINKHLIENNLNIPLYITSFNYTITHKNLLLDTLFIADFIIKNYVDNLELINSLSYCQLTDFQDTSINHETFYGGCGLFLKNGIPKAQYQAYKFLTYLDNDIVARGDFYVITKNRENPALLHILIYNYEHPDANSMMNLNVANDRYSSFINKEKKKVYITISSVDFNKAKIKEFAINRYYGNPFDKWITMGRPNIESIGKVQGVVYKLLSKASYPDYKEFETEIINNYLSFSTTLEPLEVKHLEILLQNKNN